MTHVTQDAQTLSCNTINKKARCRVWQFTLNNYTSEQVKKLTEGKYEYLFQEETGESGTPHLQGMLRFKNPRSFASIKKLLPKAHIEPGKSLVALVRYCSKDETRTGEIYSNFTYQKYLDTVTQEKMTPEKVLELIEEKVKKDIESFRTNLEHQKMLSELPI